MRNSRLGSCRRGPPRQLGIEPLLAGHDLIEKAALEAEIAALEEEQGCSSDDDGKDRGTHVDAAGHGPDPLKSVDK